MDLPWPAKRQLRSEAPKALGKPFIPNMAFTDTFEFRKKPPVATVQYFALYYSCLRTKNNTHIEHMPYRAQFSFQDIKHLGFVKQEADHFCHQISDDLLNK